MFFFIPYESRPYNNRIVYMIYNILLSFMYTIKYLPVLFCVPVSLQPLTEQGFSIAGNTKANWV